MHGAMKLSRRGVIAHAAALCSAAVAPGLQAFAAQIQPDDPRLHSETVRIPTPEKGLECYFSRPGGGERRGSVIVLHDYWGMRPHFQDVARRLALEGFAALAPDYASRFGGTPAEKDPAREMVSMEDWPFMIADTLAALAWLKGQGDGASRCAAVGFGWGGSAAGRLATKMKEGLAASVVFYGHAPPIEDAPAIAAPLLLNYAAADSLVDPDLPAFLAALDKNGIRYEMFRYEGTKRGFDDDTAAGNYAADAAQLAWQRTIAFLHRTVG